MSKEQSEFQSCPSQKGLAIEVSSKDANMTISWVVAPYSQEKV
ncbi:hypothetical protein [Candidatus Aciduliprofundum boonei]|uniref:Uncharacterized protein n=1 Tax=Aciduliprofundum boonei (strain DSM 19572 / T469) TaxID=439481 RepID=B5IGK5_ACIB4|nr:hypothetical protein [Candidatus Aciduliprofundum boonei]ADD08888.1 hypothetical protein Aboo_1079 [Aciduliprofundum boonei T469]EDY34410.1 hypothetical protein ABOONEI_953 [Aciduliprofundum boonei T469]EDY34598.1 hypothetical protein ABOONEI_1398 [Aciduliprofundum boonei T469]